MRTLSVLRRLSGVLVLCSICSGGRLQLQVDDIVRRQSSTDLDNPPASKFLRRSWHDCKSCKFSEIPKANWLI